MKDVIFDSDDFAMQPERNCMRELLFLKNKFPKFKITLFSIPRYGNYQQDQFFKYVNTTYNWIELAMHGWRHDSNFECVEWSYNQARIHMQYLNTHKYFINGFKAPGWQISRDTYKACLDNGIWVADHKISAYTEPGVSNSERRPEGLKVYEIDHPWMVHTHTWNCVNNGLPEMIDKWEKEGYPFDKDTDFHFINEVIND